MTLQQLEYIVALDNHRQFVKAAESCYVTQPTLTMQVQKLEEEIGLKIFDRQKKPLIPTPMGEKFVVKARQILREVNHLKALVEEEKESLKGEFRIGIIPTLAPYLLPLFLKSFIHNHPETKLIIEELQTDQIITALQNGTLDLGLLVTPLNETSVREVPIFMEPFLLYLQDGHPWLEKKSIQKDAIAADDLLILKKGHCFREQTLFLCELSSTKKHNEFEYEGGSIEGLKELVKAGYGYTLVPELSIHAEEEKNVVRFDGEEPVREVSIAVHQSFTKEALIDAVHEEITANLPEKYLKKRRTMRVKWR